MAGAGADLDERGPTLCAELGDEGIARDIAPRPTTAAREAPGCLLVVEGCEVEFEAMRSGIGRAPASALRRHRMVKARSSTVPLELEAFAISPPQEPTITTLADPASVDAMAALLPRLRRAVRGAVADERNPRHVQLGRVQLPRAARRGGRSSGPRRPRRGRRLAAEAGVPLTMRGAGTSVAGNAIGSGLVVDLSRHLAGVLAVDAETLTVTVLPGTVLDDVNRAAAVHALRVGPDPSTHSRCTLGGMVGNNACGARSVRWGTTAENTLGLEVVASDGVRRRTGALGPAFDGRLAALLETHGDTIRRELPAWPRRVSGYALDWLLPERGGEWPGRSWAARARAR